MSQEKKKPWWTQIKKEWIPDIIASVLFTFFVIYLFLPASLKSIIFGYIKQFFLAISIIIKWFFTPSTLLGIIILIGVIYFIIRRVRYHLTRCASYHHDCPICDHKVHQRHRTSYQRLLSYIIPVRRYHCTHCGWEGIRVHKERRRRFKNKKKKLNTKKIDSYK
ncbi:hypothetical protein PCC7418_0145 [Halothece sp. PCC 7418]|uniref:hypothetical protein n=1 Tax=Halothece sp. (strain PCC 7418) TaxID=65093 RepID=UPI0002A0805C|nr:hypothetical protein [Halothece sp. PCC 7418]AFZ42387.1 hypothetical protein PCC7418_0145 [Halothece sp. PCC 7418]